MDYFNGARSNPITKMLSYSTPPDYRRRLPIQWPKLDAFVSAIDYWLDEYLKGPHKQRYTAKRVFDRLREECTIMLQPGIFILLSMSA